MQAQVGLKDFLTIGCAAVGAALGIIHTVTGLNQRRVKLRVTPKLVTRSEAGVYSHKTELLSNGVPGIEVLNLSALPVKIAEAGFKLKGQHGRIVPKPPFIFDDKPWPRRLDSRESVTVHLPASDAFPKNLHVAYATTDCEKTCCGDSPALKKFRAHLQKRT